MVSEVLEENPALNTTNKVGEVLFHTLFRELNKPLSYDCGLQKLELYFMAMLFLAVIPIEYPVKSAEFFRFDSIGCSPLIL